jgi:hypothetical protein
MRIEDAAVVLHLRITVREPNRAAFLAYVREAFPVFEATGGCKGAVYLDARDPERYDEVFYYDGEASYEAGERAIREDPAQVALLARWRALLDGPPEVEVVRRLVD